MRDVERDKRRPLAWTRRTRTAQANRCEIVLLDELGLTYAATGAMIDMRGRTMLK